MADLGIKNLEKGKSATSDLKKAAQDINLKKQD